MTHLQQRLGLEETFLVVVRIVDTVLVDAARPLVGSDLVFDVAVHDLRPSPDDEW